MIGWNGRRGRSKPRAEGGLVPGYSNEWQEAKFTKLIFPGRRLLSKPGKCNTRSELTRLTKLYKFRPLVETALVWGRELVSITLSEPWLSINIFSDLKINRTTCKMERNKTESRLWSSRWNWAQIPPTSRNVVNGGGIAVGRIAARKVAGTEQSCKINIVRGLLAASTAVQLHPPAAAQWKRHLQSTCIWNKDTSRNHWKMSSHPMTSSSRHRSYKND